MNASAGSAEKFLSSHAAVANAFNVQRHLASTQTHRMLRAAAMRTWREAARPKIREVRQFSRSCLGTVTVLS